MDANSTASVGYSTLCIQGKYPTTFAGVDASEIFLETHALIYTCSHQHSQATNTTTQQNI